MRHFVPHELRLLARCLDSELEAWRSRPLEAGAYPYLFVDARYEKVRVGHRIVNQGVLVVSTVRDDGFREVVALEHLAAQLGCPSSWKDECLL